MYILERTLLYETTRGKKIEKGLILVSMVRNHFGQKIGEMLLNEIQQERATQDDSVALISTEQDVNLKSKENPKKRVQSQQDKETTKTSSIPKRHQQSASSSSLQEVKLTNKIIPSKATQSKVTYFKKNQSC